MVIFLTVYKYFQIIVLEKICVRNCYDNIEAINCVVSGCGLNWRERQHVISNFSAYNNSRTEFWMYGCRAKLILRLGGVSTVAAAEVSETEYP